MTWFSFHFMGPFSRLDRVEASFTLFIWLNENVHIICYYIPFRCWKVCCYCGSVFQEDTCPNSRWWHRYLASAPYFQKCIVPQGLMQIAYGKLCLEEAQKGFWERNSAESVKKRGKVRVHEKKFVSSHHVYNTKGLFSFSQMNRVKLASTLSRRENGPIKWNVNHERKRQHRHYSNL